MKDYDIIFTTVAPGDIRGRLIRNPGYGGPSVGPFGWTWRPQISKDAKVGFHAALRDSVAADGVRNPVLLWNFSDGLFLTFGGSRVRAALEVGLEEIPAIINDYTGQYEACPRVTCDNLGSYFTDPPAEFEFGELGFDYHYNLERARRHNHDPAGFAWLEDTKPEWVDKEFPWLVPPNS